MGVDIAVACILGVIGLIGSLIVSDNNKSNVEKTNEANKEMTEATNQTNKDIADAANKLQSEQFQQSFEWNKYVQEETWNREDTQYQRRVQDLQSAGISPLALASTGYSGGATVSAPSAPQANILPSQSPMFQAFQMDPSQILGSLYNTSDQLSDILQKNEDRKLSRELKDVDVSTELLVTQAKLENATHNVELQLKSAEKIANQSNDTRLKELYEQERNNLAQLTEINRHNLSMERETVRASKAREYVDSINAFTDSMEKQYGRGVSWHIVEPDDYDTAWNEFCTDYLNFTQRLYSDVGPTSFSNSESEYNNESHSWGGKANVESNKLPVNPIGGFGAGLEKSDSKASGETSSKSENWTHYQEQLIKEFWTTHKVPVNRNYFNMYFKKD